MSGGTDMIEHRFVAYGERRVMVRRAGSGPPVVLLHESPRSSAAFVPMIEALAERFTVIAPDTPGYGGSDPLDLLRPQIADYADALKEVVDALGLERAALFGRHTGAAIAIEFANCYPAQVSGVVLEGCPAFTPEEMEELVASYLPPFRPVWDGGHVAWLWSRIRDQFSFFPWNRQGPASRLAIDMPRPSILNRIATDLLLAGDGYRVAYEAAFRYDGAAAAAAARVPAHYMATETDVLFPHLDRLHSLPDNAQIHRLTDAERLATIGDLLNACAAGLAPAPPPPEETGARRFVQVDGTSLMVRQWGSDCARPLLLVADLPGSTQGLGPIAAHLAKGRRVVAIDPPGHGLSSPAPAGTADGGIECVAHAVTSLGLGRIDVAGINSGACWAAHLAGHLGAGCGRLVLIDPPPDPAALSARLPAAALEPCWSGAHLLTAWHLARESLLYRPWYTPTIDARMPVEIGFGVDLLHQRFIDTVIAGEAFLETLQAVCEQPWPALLAPLAGRVAVVTGEGMPDAAEQAALAATASAPVMRAAPDARGFAGAIMAATDRE